MVRDWQYCNLCTGETPLIHAARQGHTDTAKFLIEHGADPSIASNLGATALHHSAGIGESLSLSLLLSYCLVGILLRYCNILLIVGGLSFFCLLVSVLLSLTHIS